MVLQAGLHDSDFSYGAAVRFISSLDAPKTAHCLEGGHHNHGRTDMLGDIRGFRDIRKTVGRDDETPEWDAVLNEASERMGWQIGTVKKCSLTRAGCKDISTLMFRSTTTLLLLSLLSISGLSAEEKDDAPRGFEPISELEAAIKMAVEKNKLLVVAVKGADDDCPHCSDAMDSGEKAVGSGVVKVFARAEALNKADTTDFPPALKERVSRSFTTGASVEFLGFNPDGTKMLASSTRKELDGDRKAISAFKKEVAAHKKALK